MEEKYLNAESSAVTRCARIRERAHTYWYYFTRSKSAVIGLIIVLLVKPAGLLGKTIREKV